MQLYSFFNSSTSYRVRIALRLKGVEHEYLGVNIRTGGHRDKQYVNRSTPPPRCLPSWTALSTGQSLAIIDWLDARYPEPRLLPADAGLRARVLELSTLIGCDIHPVNNLRILKYLQDVLKVTPEQKDARYRHWIAEGMAGVERLLAQAAEAYGGPWCFGAQPTLADCCTVPQIANALRMGCDTDAFPRSLAVYRHASEHPAFVAAEPRRQPDYTA